MKDIIEFYGTYDEENRLERHPTEFIVTTFYLDEIIHNSDKILDVAAGTGIYALYYAEKGCTVEAMDIVPKHVETLKSKILGEMELFASVGNALDLHEYEDDFFDVVLNMGPVYHLDFEEVIPCIKESIRVLKSGGKLVITYVNKFENFRDDKFMEFFNCYSTNEVSDLLSSLDIKIIKHIPSDGMPYQELEEYIKSDSPSLHQCHIWLEDNLIENDINVVNGKFIHALIIAEKNN